MAEAMKLELVSPERKLASMDVNMVQIPGADGDMTAMHNHAATVVSLRPGILRAVGTNGDIQEFIVAGGFAEISPNSISVLAERAIAKADADADFLNQELAEAEKALETAGENAEIFSLRLGDIKHLQSIL